MYPEKITILIIEDNPADARLIKEVLAETNGQYFDLKYADRLSEGLKKISKNTVDIVLLDLSLPDSDGLESLTSISEKNKDIPLIVLTGTVDLNVAIRALDVGAQDYLVKGLFDGATLSRSIRYAIERKKIEVELRKSESQYRSLFEDSIDGIYITTRGGKYVDVNTALVKMLGYKSKDELMSIDIKKELYSSEDERPGPDKRNRIFEARLKKKDGSIMNAEISSKVISDDGKPLYYQGIVRDITERKQAEEEQRNAAERLSLACHAGGIGIWELDIVKNSLVWDKQMFTLYGITPDKFSGSYEAWRAGVHPDDFQKSEEEVQMAMRGEKEFDTAFRVVWPDDTIHTIRALAKVQRDTSGKAIKLIGTNYDITESKRVEVEIKEGLSKLKRAFEQTIATLGNIIEVKDPYTSGHQKKVAAISMIIAKGLGLSKETIEAIRTASLIHDIGKISIPQSILSKPSKLTDIERAMIETHPATGYDIVKEIDFPQAVTEMILQHHERINGSGYPSKLKGDGIMLEAKIIAVADVFEAMTSHRPYRAALSLEVGMDELIKNKGTLYDPDVVDCLTNYVNSYYKVELGDHLCSIYNDFEVQISYIVPYMDIGLKKNHKCIYITGENSKENIITAFRINGTNLSAYLEKGQFVFFTSNDTYLKDGYFDPDRMVSLLKATEKAALKEGFAGIRVTSEMAWILSKLPGTERYMEYENKLNDFFPGSKATAICQYSESKFDNKILNEVIKAHPKVGVNGLFYNNKFYKEPSAVSSKDELNVIDYKDIEKTATHR